MTALDLLMLLPGILVGCLVKAYAGYEGKTGTCEIFHDEFSIGQYIMIVLMGAILMLLGMSRRIYGELDFAYGESGKSYGGMAVTYLSLIILIATLLFCSVTDKRSGQVYSVFPFGCLLLQVILVLISTGKVLILRKGLLKQLLLFIGVVLLLWAFRLARADAFLYLSCMFSLVLTNPDRVLFVCMAMLFFSSVGALIGQAVERFRNQTAAQMQGDWEFRKSAWKRFPFTVYLTKGYMIALIADFLLEILVQGSMM